MKSLVVAFAAVNVVVLASAPVADPTSLENGCHGYYTTQYEELSRGIVAGRGRRSEQRELGRVIRLMARLISQRVPEQHSRRSSPLHAAVGSQAD